MTENIHRANNFLILAGGAALIGFAPIFVRWSDMSPSWILFYRMLLALPLLVLINLYLNKSVIFKIQSKKSLYIAFFAAIAFTIDLTLWHWSIGMTSISNGTIIVNSAPIFVALIYFFYFKEKLTKYFFISLGVTYFGVIGLILSANNYTSGNLLGDFFCIIAAFFYATYLVLISRLGKEEALSVIFYTSLFVCIFSIPSALIESSQILPPTFSELINLFLLALLCQVGGQFMITYSIARISPSGGSIGLLLQPVTATICAAYIFAETVNITQMLFICIALFGIYLARINLANT
jgi:drug/metabolite transporter (DMT)-like permease